MADRPLNLKGLEAAYEAAEEVWPTRLSKEGWMTILAPALRAYLDVADDPLKYRARAQDAETDALRAKHEAERQMERARTTTAFARWIMSLDDPPGSKGAEERRQITLTAIIRRAAEALEVAESYRDSRQPCPEGGCPGREYRDGKFAGCGHPTKTSGCPGG